MPRGRRVLFLQSTNAGYYPPIINAANLFADRGWHVTILSSPSVDTATLTFEEHPRINHLMTPLRSRNEIRLFDYLYYILAAIRHALRLRPTLIYASDAMGTLPALAASKVSGAQIVYHEHDCPDQGSLHPWLAGARLATVRAARLIVLPNEVRSVLAREELGFADDRLKIVWNLPRLAELPILAPQAETPLIIYYHGSITPQRLPESVVEAVGRFRGRIRLRLAGYEAPGARGYVARLLALGQASNGDSLIQYVGPIPRTDLLTKAVQAHVGLALMPRNATDVNMLHMAGASNKAFDYMAAGLALLVSDLADWREMFVTRGFARACDPADADSVAAALGWFVDNTSERRAMAARARAKIENEWNYDAAFAQVINVLNDD